MSILIKIFIFLIVSAIGFAVGYFSGRKYVQNLIEDTQKKADQIIRDAKSKASSIIKEAEIESKEIKLSLKDEFDRQTKKQKQELINWERKLRKKEEHLDHKIIHLERKENNLNRQKEELERKKRELERKENKIEELIEQQKIKLQEIAGLSREQAKEILLKEFEEEAKKEAAVIMKKIIDDAKDKATVKAKEIIATAIQRCSSEYIAENSVVVIDLPNDEMKGRIIGREGRNIKALETATGVDLIIDDTPEAVILSGFDSIRREIAAIALRRLINDGRIHPARIEEVVEQVRKEMDNRIKEIGEETLFELGIHNVHPELVKLLGRLKYRTSYAQNVLGHSKEVAYLSAMMAAELGVNVEVAKRAGLFHDIGKALDQEAEGSHAKIGAEIARKYGESEQVVNAIASHHSEVPPLSIEAILVQSADALSAARPGARREILETYLKRLQRLEEIAASFKGVEKAYAIQAGREVRIMVQPEEISDSDMIVLAREIAKKITNELEFPGEVKVTLIREKRVIDYAR